MTARLLAAAVGAAAGASLLAALLVWSPWRPVGAWVAAAVVLLALPGCAAAGCAAGLRVARRARPGPTVRLTAWSSPVLVVFMQFAVQSVAGTARPGGQQVAALVLGGAAAGALAARFTAPELDEDG